MHINDIHTRINVNNKSIYPALEMRLHFEIKNETENVIFQSGFLKIQDNFKIAPIYLFGIQIALILK